MNLTWQTKRTGLFLAESTVVGGIYMIIPNGMNGGASWSLTLRGQTIPCVCSENTPVLTLGQAIDAAQAHDDSLRAAKAA